MLHESTVALSEDKTQSEQTFFLANVLVGIEMKYLSASDVQDSKSLWTELSSLYNRNA